MTKPFRITALSGLGGSLCGAALLFALLFSSAPAAAADRSNDEFMVGYITSIVERELHWETGSYRLKVVGGIATITLFKEDPARQKEGEEKLSGIAGLQKVAIVVAPAAGKPGAVSRTLGVTGEVESLPVGDVFHPLIADPKQPRFFVSLNRYDNSVRRYTGASVGFGETFGLYKFIGAREGDGLQLSVEGALFAQFDMDTSSHDLVNADYTIGIPVTYRSGDNSVRFRLYHQSSHLGDEYLLRSIHAQRVNLSFESLEFLYSREWRTWRVYGGGEYLIHKEPADLKPGSFHWGLEYLGVTPLVLGGRLVGAVDMKSMEQHHWETDISAKAGLEFGQPYPGHRRLRLMGQWYKGFDPHGQFYNNRIEYYGLELALGF